MVGKNEPRGTLDARIPETVGCLHSAFLGVAEILGKLLEKRYVTACEPVNRLPVIAHAEEFRQRSGATERLQETVSVKRYVLKLINKDVVIIGAITAIAESSSLNNCVSEIYGIILPAYLLIALNERDDNAVYGLKVAVSRLAAQLLD